MIEKQTIWTRFTDLAWKLHGLPILRCSVH